MLHIFTLVNPPEWVSVHHVCTLVTAPHMGQCSGRVRTEARSGTIRIRSEPQLQHSHPVSRLRCRRHVWYRPPGLPPSARRWSGVVPEASPWQLLSGRGLSSMPLLLCTEPRPRPVCLLNVCYLCQHMQIKREEMSIVFDLS